METTKEQTASTKLTQKQQFKGGLLLTAAIALIYLGFALDGITEYGHHGLLILGGIMIGVGIGKLDSEIRK